jgi:hypothetical protein
MPKSISELKANIEKEIKNISKDFFKTCFFLIFVKDVIYIVISAGGGHFKKYMIKHFTGKLHFLSSLKLYIAREKAT